MTNERTLSVETTSGTPRGGEALSGANERERGNELIDQVLADIAEVEDRVAHDLHLEPHSAEAVAAADQALVHIARAGAHGQAPEAFVSNATRDVAIEGALEVSGAKTSAGDNPAAMLDHDPELHARLTAVVAELHETHVELPNGVNAAEATVAAIEKHPMSNDVVGVEYVTDNSASSRAWIQEKNLGGVGSDHRIKEMLKDTSQLPDLSPEIARQLLSHVAKSGSTDFTKVFLRYPEAPTAELLTTAYAHPEATAALVKSQPELARYMSQVVVKSEVEARSLIDLYDTTDSDEVRTSIAHHSAVLADPDSAQWARNTSMALVYMNAFEAGLGSVAPGAVNYNSAFKASDNRIGNRNIPLASIMPTTSARDAHLTAKRIEDMTIDERSMVLSESYIASHPQFGEATDISLADLRPDFQELVVAESLIESYKTTHDAASQKAASERNIALLEGGSNMETGGLVHTTSAKNLKDILDNGLVCGELIGEASINDAYPLNVDFNQVEPQDVDGKNFREAMRSATVGWHDAGSPADRITLLLPRERAFEDRVADLSKQDHKHRLAFGAVPATELSGIVLSDTTGYEAQSAQIDVIKTVLAQNTYIPIFDNDGGLVLSPDEFRAKQSTRLTQLEAMTPSREVSTNDAAAQHREAQTPVNAVPDIDMTF